jgi:hypothetical protein
MQTPRWIAATLAATLVVTLVPSAAFAGDRDAVVRTPILGRDAIAQAVRSVVADRPAPSTVTIAPTASATAPRTPARAPRARQGGGKGMMVMSIVSAVVGLGATYYMLKELRKTTNPSNDDGE